jgi:hypothetical protein
MAVTTIAVFAMNDNGLTYSAEYGPAANDCVRWSAIYRFRGIFRGLRHGRVPEISGLSDVDVLKSVMDDIEDAWKGTR